MPVSLHHCFRARLFVPSHGLCAVAVTLSWVVFASPVMAQPSLPKQAPLPARVKPASPPSSPAPVTPGGSDSSPKPVGPVKPVGVVAPVNVNALPAASGVLPGAPTALSTVPTALSPAARQASLVMAELLAGRRTVAEAQKSGDLTPEVAWHVLDKSLDWWGRFDGGVDNAQLRRALAQIIVEHASQRLQPAFEPTAALSEVALSSSSAPLISPVPLSVRTWVADYLSSVNDARCIVLYEGLLKDLDSQPQRKAVMSSWSWVHPVGSLAESYAQFLRFEKAAQVWERAPEYSNNPAWLADATLEAARARRRAGQEEKAAKLYAKVPQYGNGWFTGVALYDQAYQLIENGKHTEARALLLQPVTGERAEAVQVGLWTLAAYSFFSTGDFVSSTQFSKAALNQFKTLKDPSKHMGIDLQVKIAQNTLLWSKRWKEQPFTCEPKEIRAVLQRGENQPSWRITVRSFSAIPLSVQVTDARLKAQVSPSSSPVVLGKRYYFEQEVIVEAVPELIEKALTATMTISSPATPNFQAHVLVSLDVKEQ